MPILYEDYTPKLHGETTYAVSIEYDLFLSAMEPFGDGGNLPSTFTVAMCPCYCYPDKCLRAKPSLAIRYPIYRIVDVARRISAWLKHIPIIFGRLKRAYRFLSGDLGSFHI